MNIDGIFLFCPCTVPDSEQRNVPDDVETFVDEDLEAGIPAEDAEDFDDYLGEAIVATKETWQRYKTEILPAYKIVDSDFCKNFRETGYALSFHDQLRNLQFEEPVTVFTGRQDDSAGYEDSWEMLKHLPRLTFVALDAVGNLMQIENPDAFNFLVLQWLKRVEMGKGE